MLRILSRERESERERERVRKLRENAEVKRGILLYRWHCLNGQVKRERESISLS